MNKFVFVSLLLFAPVAYSVDSQLNCQIFVNGMPYADLELAISGTEEKQVSKKINTPNGNYKAEISWGGFFEEVPLNPEIRLQTLDAQGHTIVESYKNVDLLKIEKSDECCEADNVGLKTSNDTVYLSCKYKKN